MTFPDPNQEASYQRLIQAIFNNIKRSNIAHYDTYEELESERTKLALLDQWLTNAALNNERRYNSSSDSMNKLMERWLRLIMPNADWDQVKKNDEAWARLLTDVPQIIHFQTRETRQSLDNKTFAPELPEFLQTKKEPQKPKVIESTAPLISDVLPKFQQFRKGNNPNMHSDSLNAYSESIRDLIFIIGDKAIDQYTFDDAENFRKTLKSLPPNRNKLKAYKNKNVTEILENPPTRLLSSTTVSKKLDNLRSIYDWLQKRGDVSNNPFSLTKEQSKKQSFTAFNESDLKIIFSSDLYIQDSPYYKKSTTTVGHWWIFPLLLYTGSRPAEIMQINISDIKCHDNIWFFDLTDEEGSKQLKTKASKRIVPIHNKLIELGILDYIDQCRKRNFKRLLESISTTTGKPSRKATKWYGELYRDKYLVPSWKEEKKSLYSTRHTYITNSIQNKSDDKLRFQIVGHEQEQLKEQKPYYEGGLLKDLQETMNLVDYKGVDISHIKNGWKDLMGK